MILDTNALSAFAEGDEELGERLKVEQDLHLPVVVLGEYRFGVRQSRHRKAYEKWLREALSQLEVLPILDSTTEHYAALCEELRGAGTPIPTNDAWVAALSREHRLPVVSRDAHFDLVQGLRRISW
ncbi:type II toxin-antitoxin system VapC family toxin [Candidatus Latescibacterota bacterium]